MLTDPIEVAAAGEVEDASRGVKVAPRDTVETQRGGASEILVRLHVGSA